MVVTHDPFVCALVCVTLCLKGNYKGTDIDSLPLKERMIFCLAFSQKEKGNYCKCILFRCNIF